MKRIKACFLASALALSVAGPCLAQGGPPGGQAQWWTNVDAAAAYQSETDLDGGGSFSVSRGVVGAGVNYGTGFQNSVGLSISAGRTVFDFSDRNDLWGGIDEFSISAPVSFGVGDSVTALVIPTLRYSGENGVSWNDGQTGGVIVGAAWRVSDTLTVGPGLGAITTLDDDVSVFPFLLIDWEITDRVNLSTGRGLGASRGPGLTLSYEVSESLSLGVAGRYEDVEFRLDDDGVAPGGIGRDRVMPLVATLDWNPNAGISVSAFAGMSFSGNLELKDSNGRKVEDRDYDAAPIFGASAAFTF